MTTKSHWENVYATTADDKVSWYREHLDKSIEMILQTGVQKNAAIIDVGGGSSTLVDDLLDHGFLDVTVLDISATAIEKSKERLSNRKRLAHWIEADITEARLQENHFDVWHDRAVFHFLTNAEDRQKYVHSVVWALKPGGHIIVASFGMAGPEKCSGLEVVRYNADTMHDEFGSAFELVKCFDETHTTPFATTQKFIYCYCKKNKP